MMYNKKCLCYVFAVLALCSFCVSCGGNLAAQWGKLTLDEKSRVVLDGMQDQLDTSWKTGMDYVKKNPQYSQTWVTEITPAFSTANKKLAEYMGLVSAGTKTPVQALTEMEPFLGKITELMKKIGIIEGVK